MLFSFHHSDVMFYRSGLIEASKPRIEFMKKNEFIKSIANIWEYLEVSDVLDITTGIIVGKENKISVEKARMIARLAVYMKDGLQFLNPSELDLLGSIDRDGLLDRDINSVIFVFHSSVEAQSQKMEVAQKNTSAYIQRSWLLSNTAFPRIHSFLSELDGIYQVSLKLSQLEGVNVRHTDNYLKLKLYSQEGYNTITITEFMQLLETSVRFLCEHYDVDYEPMEILSVETGSLDFITALPMGLYEIIGGAFAAATAVAGVIHAAALSSLNFKVSLEKTKQAEIETLIKQEQLKEAQTKTINSTLQTGVHITQMRKEMTLSDELSSKSELAIVLDALEKVLPDDIGEKNKTGNIQGFLS